MTFAKQIFGRGSTQTDHNKKSRHFSNPKKTKPKKQYQLPLDSYLACCRRNQIKKASGIVHPKSIQFMVSYFNPDRLVVRTLRCGRSSLGSNLGLNREFLAEDINGRGSTQIYHQKQLTLLKSMKK